MYWQGGRIITTLAMAWPHLTTAQQLKTRIYIRAELQDDQRAPWTPKGFIPPASGVPRELHPFHEPRGWDRYWAMWGNRKPTMGAFYGLWLYADRSGDWATLQSHYHKITELYSRKAARPPRPTREPSSCANCGPPKAAAAWAWCCRARTRWGR